MSKDKEVRNVKHTQLTSPFFIRVSEGDETDKGVIVDTADDERDIALKLTGHVQAANLMTRRDGKKRHVRVEKLLSVTSVETTDEPVMNWHTKRLMMAEIDNEEKGGEKPATLRSAFESVLSGYNPDEQTFTEDDMKQVGVELTRLTDLYGNDAALENFVTAHDWAKRG